MWRSEVTCYNTNQREKTAQRKTLCFFKHSAIGCVSSSKLEATQESMRAGELFLWGRCPGTAGGGGAGSISSTREHKSQEKWRKEKKTISNHFSIKKRENPTCSFSSAFCSSPKRNDYENVFYLHNVCWHIAVKHAVCCVWKPEASQYGIWLCAEDCIMNSLHCHCLGSSWQVIHYSVINYWIYTTIIFVTNW